MPDLAIVQAEIASHMEAIAALFQPGSEVTLIVRNPRGERVPGSQDFVMTSDALPLVAEVIARRMEADAPSPPTPRARSVLPVLTAPAHDGVEKRCVVMHDAAVHTIGLPEGHFASIVLSRASSEIAAIAILDRAEVEAHIRLLRNAIGDAERLDRGEAAVHAAPSLRRS